MKDQIFASCLHRFGDPGCEAYGKLAAAHGEVLFQTEPDISHIPVGRCIATPWNRLKIRLPVPDAVYRLHPWIRPRRCASASASCVAQSACCWRSNACIPAGVPEGEGAYIPCCKNSIPLSLRERARERGSNTRFNNKNSSNPPPIPE